MHASKAYSFRQYFPYVDKKGGQFICKSICKIHFIPLSTFIEHMRDLYPITHMYVLIFTIKKKTDTVANIFCSVKRCRRCNSWSGNIRRYFDFNSLLCGQEKTVNILLIALKEIRYKCTVHVIVIKEQ